MKEALDFVTGVSGALALIVMLVQLGYLAAKFNQLQSSLNDLRADVRDIRRDIQALQVEARVTNQRLDKIEKERA